ncbi:hypothetical protein UY3_13866 [Chelonia mydas]|uniref:Uncharacterized protein n=1 Tax=Chelonia mydas TaxID=8469 RepID=M7AUC9_CHEMY|nr:hypothetical protein UY3_13866 [Chelonia mydas]
MDPRLLWVSQSPGQKYLGFFHYHEELNNSVRIVLSPKRQEAEFHASHSRSHITSPSKILGSPYSNVTDQLPHIKSCLHQEWLQLLAQVGALRSNDELPEAEEPVPSVAPGLRRHVLQSLWVFGGTEGLATKVPPKTRSK